MSDWTKGADFMEMSITQYGRAHKYRAADGRQTSKLGKRGISPVKYRVYFRDLQVTESDSSITTGQ